MILNTLTIMTNDGNGGFALASTPIVGDGPDCVCTADVNGDGKMELICANAVGQMLTVLTNDGEGNFTLSSLLPDGISSQCVIAADINGEGKVDLVCANYESPLMIYTNDGSGGFVFASQYFTGGLDCVVAADVNGDGKLDLISANLDNTLTMLINATILSPSTFTPPLAIKPSGLGMQISWPSDSPGWSLEQNPDLTTANWGPSGYSGFNISDDETTKSLTMPSSSGNLFFHLLHP
jgi:hypothetical protein